MNISYDTFAANVFAIQEKINAACNAAGRKSGSVKLLAVTKTHGPQAVLWAARAGLPGVGENRVQEAVEKRPGATALLQTENIPALPWELIGHLQSNKSRLAMQHFDRIQSVDSVKLVQILDRLASETDRKFPILLQINAGRDTAKFGAELEDAPALCEAALNAKNLRLDGLMTIAPLSDDQAEAENTFATLAELRATFQTRYSTPLPELSMGMSGDFALAIKHGSTLIRVGTALFGGR